MKTKSNTLLTLVLAFMTAASALAMSGCNTTAGVGKDVEAAGSAIEEKAEEKKKY